MLRPFREGGIAARLAMILMLLMLLALGLSVGWYVKDRADAATHLFANSAARRIDNVVRLLDRLPAAERPALIRAASGPTMRIELKDGPPPPDEELMEDRHAMRHARDLLSGLGDRPMMMSRVGEWDRPLFGRRPRSDDPDLFPSRRKLIVATTLADGQWLHATLATDLTSLRWALRSAFWVLCMMLVIGFFSVWAAHRATRPLRSLAAAADRLGLDVDATPLPERGSRELKKTARAFNTMQQRIKRLVDDRTLMLAALSHDLKTMLTRLRLRAEFIDDAEQQRKAERDIDDMQMMVDAALGFVRGDQANEPVVRLDLVSLVRDMAEDWRDDDVRFEGPARLAVNGRPVALKRAVGNLIDNAVRYGGNAEIRIWHTDHDAVLTVADDGPGLPEAELEKVFQPFYRVETSRSRDTGGTGLGLALARDVFRRLGGDLTIANRARGGLMATARLPLPAGPA
ncbi:ATP-binding protein [Minwuia thermotolerans]|nr:ATP-binding protein [Minwuia thermotolerans]